MVDTSPITQSPIDTHRAEAPVWAFHALVGQIVWLGAVLAWWWNAEIVRVRGKDALFVAACLTTLAAAVIAFRSVQ